MANPEILTRSTGRPEYRAADRFVPLIDYHRPRTVVMRRNRPTAMAKRRNIESGTGAGVPGTLITSTPIQECGIFTDFAPEHRLRDSSVKGHRRQRHDEGRELHFDLPEPR